MKILIIEDEKELRETIKNSLEKENFLVEEAADYHSAIDKVLIYSYDCILLDIMLPGGSGLKILETLNQANRNESVLIISAKDSIDDKITGLNLGADDYLTKPFHLAELTARVKTIIRRKGGASRTPDIQLGNITLNPEKRTVFIDNNPLILNRKEFDILYYFITNPDRVIGKLSIAESVWGDDIDQADNFDFIYSQIKNLRKKLKTMNADYGLVAVYGFGYKFSR